MRILFLIPQWAWPPTQGAAIRNSHLIAGLAARHAVAVCSFAPVGSVPGQSSAPHVRPPPDVPPLAAWTLVPATAPRGPRARLRTLLTTGLPDMAQRLASPALAAAAARMLAVDAYDWVVVEGIEMAPYMFALMRHATRNLDLSEAEGTQHAPCWLYDAHNAEYLLQQRVALADLPRAYRPRVAAGAAYSLVQWRRLRAYERAVCRAAHAVTAVSEADRAALQLLEPRRPVTVVPNGVDLDEWDPATAPPDPDVTALRAAGPLIVFDGSMDFRPNVDAARWFCYTCWPRIRVARPDASFAIVGRNPAPMVQALGAMRGVHVTGAVADPRPWVAGADVYAVPMRMGGGVRLKVLQALALGRPLVSTRLGVEGVDLRAGRDYLLADTAAAFSASVLALLADSPRRAALGAAARAAVAPYAWAQIVPRFEAVLTTDDGRRTPDEGRQTADGTRQQATHSTERAVGGRQ